MGISANKEKVFEYGIKQYFPIWSSIGGRFSVSSAVGGVPISLVFGYSVFKAFL